MDEFSTHCRVSNGATAMSFSVWTIKTYLQDARWHHAAFLESLKARWFRIDDIQLEDKMTCDMQLWLPGEKIQSVAENSDRGRIVHCQDPRISHSLWHSPLRISCSESMSCDSCAHRLYQDPRFLRLTRTSRSSGSLWHLVLTDLALRAYRFWIESFWKEMKDVQTVQITVLFASGCRSQASGWRRKEEMGAGTSSGPRNAVCFQFSNLVSV